MKLLRILLVVFALALASAGARAAFDWKKLVAPQRKTPTSQQPIAVAGVRGLDEPGSPGDMNARDPESVAWMEKRNVSKDDVDTFIVTGGLEP